MEGLIEGRQVHYVMTGQEGSVLGHVAGEHRAATVVRVWDASRGYVNLLVHVDGYNDLAADDTTVFALAQVPQLWVTSILYSDGKEPGTWHWIERA